METERNEGLESVEPISVTQNSQGIDYKRIVRLIVNPLESLKLSDKDFLYGIIGLASSYVAFLLWSLLVTKRISEFLNPFYELASLFGAASSRGSLFFATYSKLLLTGLWGIIALLGVVWLVSWWQSGGKPEIKAFVTRIGGIHYIGCAGYLLACILSVSFSLSILIVSITLLILLVLTLVAGAELYRVAHEKLSLYFIVAIAGYIILFSFIPQLLF